MLHPLVYLFMPHPPCWIRRFLPWNHRTTQVPNSLFQPSLIRWDRVDLGILLHKQQPISLPPMPPIPHLLHLQHPL